MSSSSESSSAPHRRPGHAIADRNLGTWSTMSSSRTPGGARLRGLREAIGKTQLSVELEAGIGTGYLQRVESGRVVQPERATLERMLMALGARYSERRDVLELFGYLTPAPLPTSQDLEWARDVSRRELDEVALPAYVLDCRHRLVAWNQQVPHIFGVDPADPALGELAGRSILAAWFDPDSPLSRVIAEPADFLPAMIRAFRSEMQLFHYEEWYPPLIEELRQLPDFRFWWEAVEQEPAVASAARALVPLGITAPAAGPLRFRLSSEHFVRDARFRIVYLFPADPTTMRHCAGWAAEALATGG